MGLFVDQVINYESLNDEATQGQPDDREKGSNKSFEVALEGAPEFFEPQSRDNKND